MLKARRASATAHLVGDEGGYGPRLRTNAQAVEHILEAAARLRARARPRRRDRARRRREPLLTTPRPATYRLGATGDDALDAAGMIALLEHWARLYPIVSIEDGLAEDDWDGWAALTARLGGIGPAHRRRPLRHPGRAAPQGIERRAANAVLIKLNQVGTLSETLDAIRLARRHGYRTIVSARSGETEDTTIADLAVATAAGQIKIGSVARSERLAKYNRLLRIEEQLGKNASYEGRSAVGGSSS